MPVDAVVADFISGAIEQLAPARDDDGWDVIEGQGSLFHPSLRGRLARPSPRRAAGGDRALPRAGPRRICAASRAGRFPIWRECLERNLEAARLTSPDVRAVGHLPQHLGRWRGTRPAASATRSRTGWTCLHRPGRLRRRPTDRRDPMPRTLHAQHDRFALSRPFRIARGVKTVADVITVTIDEEGTAGRGEGVPYPRYGESVESIARRDRGSAGGDRGRRRPADALSRCLPAGRGPQRGRLRACGTWRRGARASMSQAMIGSVRHRSPGQRPHPRHRHARGDGGGGGAICRGAVAQGQGRCRGSGRANPRGPGRGAELGADRRSQRKLGPEADGGDAARARRSAGRVDRAAGARRRGFDGWRASSRPFRSAPTNRSTSPPTSISIARRYQAVNVKLDKAGGLTAALELAQAARARGLGLMTGCMVSSSLSIAPALPRRRALGLRRP